MTDNETIARWLECRFLGERLSIEDGDVYFSEGVSHRLWAPDTDITHWHGKDGLLTEIEKKALVNEFVAAWAEGNGWDCLGEGVFCLADLWEFRRAESAELAPALVKVIKGEGGGE